MPSSILTCLILPLSHESKPSRECVQSLGSEGALSVAVTEIKASNHECTLFSLVPEVTERQAVLPQNMPNQFRLNQLTRDIVIAQGMGPGARKLKFFATYFRRK